MPTPAGDSANTPPGTAAAPDHHLPRPSPNSSHSPPSPSQSSSRQSMAAPSVSTVADVLATLAGLAAADHFRARDESRSSYLQSAMRFLSAHLRHARNVDGSGSASTDEPHGEARGGTRLRSAGDASTSTSTSTSFSTTSVADIVATVASMAAADHASAREQGRDSQVESACRWLVDRLGTVDPVAAAQRLRSRAATAYSISNNNNNNNNNTWRPGRDAVHVQDGAGFSSSSFSSHQTGGRHETDEAMTAAERVRRAWQDRDSHDPYQSHGQPAADSEADVDGGPICAICQDRILAGDALMRLECFHEYHEECVSTFLQSAAARSSSPPLCPSCRYPVTAALAALPVRVVRGDERA